MSISQGEAVYQACCEQCNENPGDGLSYKPSFEKKELAEIYERVFQMFMSGKTVHTKNPSPEQLRKYIPGLVNNWLRRDKRLNGGVKYAPKKPGSRRGSLRAMRTLLGVTTDPVAKQQIQAAINARLKELKPKVVVNAEALPEALRHLVK